jgi:hypothetical protein
MVTRRPGRGGLVADGVEGLLERERNGHVPGAFTGATDDRAGSSRQRGAFTALYARRERRR